MVNKKGFFLLMFVMVLTIFVPITTNASTLVSDENSLVNALTTGTEEEVILSNDITLTKRINVSGSKVLNLNGYTLNAKESIYFTSSGGINLKNANKAFTIKNGQIVGGPDIGLSVWDTESGFIFAHQDGYDLKVLVQDITHTGVGFFKGRSSDITFKGNVKLNNTRFNVRALNILMYGNKDDELDTENVDFYGYVDKYGAANPEAIGDGAVNISFDGYQTNSKFSVGKTTKNMDIEKNAKVELVNAQGTFDGNLPYFNAIGNFAQVNIYGELDISAQGPAFRTTSAYLAGYVGTASDQSEINVYEGSVLKATTNQTQNTYGVLYSYSLDLNINSPKVFDLRNYGDAVFFYGWYERNQNNFRIKNSDVAVWNKEARGIGNPLDLWQDVKSIEINKFYYGDTAATMLNKTTSNPSDIASKFFINNFSRISNDVTLPLILPDSSFINSSGNVVVENGASNFNGTTNYYYPDLTLADKPASGATLSLYSGTTLVDTTKADSDGNWSFDDFNKLKLKAGTYTLKLVDEDQRTAKDVTITVTDTLPPEATSKLYMILQGTQNALSNTTAKSNSVATSIDETSAANDITATYDLTEEEKTNIINTIGYYEVPVTVKDAAGNTTQIMAPVIVYYPDKPTNAFVSGNDFEIPFDTWNEASDLEKREIFINSDYANAKGYTISGNTVTDVTENESLFKITYTTPADGWRPGSSYTAKLTVNSYSQDVTFTLGKKEVNIKINQYYSDTSTPIYTDLENKSAAVSISTIGEIDEPINDVIDQLILDKTLVINYEGYNDITKTDYVVKVNNAVVSSTTILDKDFEIDYYYTGKTYINSSPDLNFGIMKVSNKKETYSLPSATNSSVDIINTNLDKNWELKLSLPNGIANKSTDKQFIGGLTYVDKDGQEIPISSSATSIYYPNEPELTTKLNMSGADESGMKLIQESGNATGEYEGTILWSLEDVLIAN